MAEAGAEFPFHLGQFVRRIDGSDIGMVVGILLQPRESIMVRWADETTYETPDELIEVGLGA